VAAISTDVLATRRFAMLIKSPVKQEDPVWNFVQANAHFIRNILCNLNFYLVWERRSHNSFLTLHPWEHKQMYANFSRDNLILRLRRLSLAWSVEAGYFATTCANSSQ